MPWVKSGAGGRDPLTKYSYTSSFLSVCWGLLAWVAVGWVAESCTAGAAVVEVVGVTGSPHLGLPVADDLTTPPAYPHEPRPRSPAWNRHYRLKESCPTRVSEDIPPIFATP